MRVPAGEAQQVLGRRAGERVDRLVIVADHAEVVALAEPAFEQAGLERVHVLVFVDGERGEAPVDLARGVAGARRTGAARARACPRSRAAPSRSCAARTRLDAVHQVRRDRRVVVAELVEVPPAGSSGSWPTRSRRELAPGQELVRRWSAFASEEMSGALWSSTSGSGSPVYEDHSLESCESAAEWNVRASTPSTPSAWRRRASSPAALSVNVTARICDGSNAPLRTWHAMRCVIVVVLPVPAPAGSRLALGARGRPRAGLVQAGEDVRDRTPFDPSTGPDATVADCSHGRRGAPGPGGGGADRDQGRAGPVGPPGLGAGSVADPPEGSAGSRSRRCSRRRAISSRIACGRSSRGRGRAAAAGRPLEQAETETQLALLIPHRGSSIEAHTIRRTARRSPRRASDEAAEERRAHRTDPHGDRRTGRTSDAPACSTAPASARSSVNRSSHAERRRGPDRGSGARLDLVERPARVRANPFRQLEPGQRSSQRADGVQGLPRLGRDDLRVRELDRGCTPDPVIVVSLDHGRDSAYGATFAPGARVGGTRSV